LPLLIPAAFARQRRAQRRATSGIVDIRLLQTSREARQTEIAPSLLRREKIPFRYLMDVGGSAITHRSGIQVAQDYTTRHGYESLMYENARVRSSKTLCIRDDRAAVAAAQLQRSGSNEGSGSICFRSPIARCASQHGFRRSGLNSLRLAPLKPVTSRSDVVAYASMKKQRRKIPALQTRSRHRCEQTGRSIKEMTSMSAKPESAHVIPAANLLRHTLASSPIEAGNASRRSRSSTPNSTPVEPKTPEQILAHMGEPS